MRILMLGAGGIGGYFGARIHKAGGDVTFLVRPARAKYLLTNGLQVFSPLGDIHITPKIITSEQGGASEKYDVVMLSCKAYDIDAAITSVAPVLNPNSLIIPLLNGFSHLARLDLQFGRERVLGGLAHLGVTLKPGGEIQHLNELHRLVIGCRAEYASPLISFLAELLALSGIDFSLSKNIEAEMWDKFVFLSTLAGATCTMRSSIGDILQTHSGERFIVGLFAECISIAREYGQMPNQERLATYQSQLTAQGSMSTSSMLRDIERKEPTEADHIIGDMVRRADATRIDAPLLKIAYSHLQAYETRRKHVNGLGHR